MKGFNTGDGYMGMVDGEYILFASEADYYDYVNDQKSKQNFQKNNACAILNLINQKEKFYAGIRQINQAADRSKIFKCR